MPIPAGFIQDLVARADVVEIVGRHVPLKKAGANYMGLCPFHGEKSPSFSVSPTKQFYHCFGCGANGNAIGFLMEHLGMGFVEAVHDLAGQYGMQVPEEQGSAEERARAATLRQKQTTLGDVLARAGAAYKANLKRSPRAVEYLKGRGLSGEVAREFGLGYAPEGWRALASVFPDYNDPLLVESGLVITSEDEEDKRYDRFRDRIMFPIRNVKGEHIGFGGRVLGDEKPKYLNSPETPVFSKGRELYGLFEARTALRQHGYALVTEGYMDVVALAQLGFPNAVATLGTACTAEHVHKLFRFTESVVFSFDGDAAGRRAARKALDAAIPFANDTRSVKFLFLPAEHDPDSFIREHGSEAFARFVNEATPLSRFLVESAREGCDLGSAEGRAHLSSNARPLWSALPEGALKQQLLAEIAALVQLDLASLQSLWAAAAAPRRGGGGSGAASSSAPPPDDGAMPWMPDFENEPWPPAGDGGGYGAGYGGHGDGGSGGGKGWQGKRRFDGGRGRGRGWQQQQPNHPRLPRVQPLGRAEVAARLLLADMAPWGGLTHELHTLLCDARGEVGELFRWLDAQFHEHGNQPWAALREGLRGHAAEALALRLMTGPDGAPVAGEAAPEQSPADAEAELRDVLSRLLIERLGEELTETAQAFGSDPAAPQRYRALEARRRELQMTLKA